MKTRIKKVRTTFGLTQSEFAERIQLSRSALCKIETGVNTASPRTIAKICQEFRTRRDWLIDGSGPAFLPEYDEQLRLIELMDGEDTATKKLLFAIANNPSEEIANLTLDFFNLINQKQYAALASVLFNCKPISPKDKEIPEFDYGLSKNVIESSCGIISTALQLSLIKKYLEIYKNTPPTGSEKPEDSDQTPTE